MPSKYILQIGKFLPDELKEFQKDFELEGGWWHNMGDHVLVMSKDYVDDIDTLATLLHEFTEAFLETEMGYDHEDAHKIARIIEILATNILWLYQDTKWKYGRERESNN